MSFEIMKLPTRLVGQRARYRVARSQKRVAVMLRKDAAAEAGLSAGDWVLVALGKREHAGLVALKRLDDAGGSRDARRLRQAGSTLMVEIPYVTALAKVLPAAGDQEKQTQSLEVVETDKEGAITLRKAQRRVG